MAVLSQYSKARKGIYAVVATIACAGKLQTSTMVITTAWRGYMACTLHNHGVPDETSNERQSAKAISQYGSLYYTCMERPVLQSSVCCSAMLYTGVVINLRSNNTLQSMSVLELWMA